MFPNGARLHRGAMGGIMRPRRTLPEKTDMSDSPSLIMVQFLTWVAERPRTRDDAVEAWHSCPHIAAYEDAIVDGFVRIENDGRRTIALTPRGRAALAQAKTPVL
jgi:hypothetical protein